MSAKNCMKKTMFGESRGYFIFCAIFTFLLVVVNYLAVRPWNFLPIDVFVYTQVITLMVIVVLKVGEFCCCLNFSDEPSTACCNTVFYLLGALFLTATIDGFSHDDLSFDTKPVEKTKDEG